MPETLDLSPLFVFNITKEITILFIIHLSFPTISLEELRHNSTPINNILNA